jgi:hypothetical protein
MTIDNEAFNVLIREANQISSRAHVGPFACVDPVEVQERWDAWHSTRDKLVAVLEAEGYRRASSLALPGFEPGDELWQKGELGEIVVFRGYRGGVERMQVKLTSQPESIDPDDPAVDILT